MNTVNPLMKGCFKKQPPAKAYIYIQYYKESHMNFKNYCEKKAIDIRVISFSNIQLVKTSFYIYFFHAWEKIVRFFTTIFLQACIKYNNVNYKKKRYYSENLYLQTLMFNSFWRGKNPKVKYFWTQLTLSWKVGLKNNPQQMHIYIYIFQY